MFLHACVKSYAQTCYRLVVLRFQFLGGVEGVLCAINSRNTVIILNPTTRQSRLLPTLPKRTDKTVSWNNAFFLELVPGVYKILCLRAEEGGRFEYNLISKGK